MCYVALNEDIVNPLQAQNSKEYTEATIKMSDQNFRVSSFSRKIHLPPQILNTALSSQGSWITAMDKGKNVQTELTEEELRRKIERITREIQRVKEEGLKVDVTTAIYKAAVTTLDDDLASQIKRKKEVEMETESLRKRLNLLRLEIHEGKAREAKIDIETAVSLAKSATLDEELATHSNLKGGKYPARKQGADDSGPDQESIEEDDEEEIV